MSLPSCASRDAALSVAVTKVTRMPIVDLFSSRQKQNSPAEDVWEYDRIPNVLRVQVSNIVSGALGDAEYRGRDPEEAYRAIVRAVAHEHGRARLAGNWYLDASEELHECLRNETDLLVWLDCVELTFRVIENWQRKFDDHDREMSGITISADDAVDEINERFRRAGFGYRYEDGRVMRIDNDLMHQEVTLPALRLLRDPRFAGADEEFRAAHAHYRAGENKDCAVCAVDALNAVESTMKTICDLKGWPYPKGARANDLVKILRQNGLFPDFAEQSFDQLVATLKSGLPTVRNENGGHGQGAVPVAVPTYIATYALNLAATNILLLMEAFLCSEQQCEN